MNEKIGIEGARLARLMNRIRENVSEFIGKLDDESMKTD